MINQLTIRNYNGGENNLQLKLIKELGEDGYVQQLYDFLQGKYHPDEIVENNKPNLTADQAWHVIYCLQEHFGMIDDKFERCRECGFIYDSYADGATIDEDSKPLIFKNNDGNEIRKDWDKTDYGNYCEFCRPD